MPSNKRWCVEVRRSGYYGFFTRRLFPTRKAAGDFLIRYGGRFRYKYSPIRRVK